MLPGSDHDLDATGVDARPEAVARAHGQLVERLARQDEEIASLCAEVLERYEEATFVYRLCERIGSVLGERALAELVLGDATAVFGAAAGEVWLTHEGEIVLAAFRGSDPPAFPSVGVRSVIDGARVWTGEIERGADASAAVALPDGRGGFLGALVLHGRPAGRGYMTGEVKLMASIGALAAAFIRNDRLVVGARRAESRRREDEIARQVHRGPLPRHDPLFAGLEVSGGFRAADGVGGDYYGYVAMSDGSLGVALADVSGHGVGAALYMATAKGALQSEARDLLSPADVLGRVNEVLGSDFSSADMFATFVFVRFQPDGRRFVWSNAGHNPPILLRRDGANLSLKPSGPALGIVSGSRWHDVNERFGEGDVLLLYTDGVVEARDRDGRFFGVERLIAAARRVAGSAASIRQNVLDELTRHTGSLPPHDDLTLVIVRGVALEEAD